MDRIKVTNDYLQIAQTKVQYSVRKVTEKVDFLQPWTKWLTGISLMK